MTSETTRRSQTRWKLTTWAKAKAKERAAAKGKGKSSGKGKGKSSGKGKDRSKSKGKGKSKGTKPDNQDKECHVCGKKGHFARDCWSRANQDRTVNEVDGAKADSVCD